MINEDDTIVTVTGDTIRRIDLVQEMINYYNRKYPDTQITDFNEGSEIRNLLESISVDLFHLIQNNYESSRVNFLSQSYGEWLDLKGAEYNLLRHTGKQAEGTVTFSLPEPAATPVNIPVNTYLSADNGMIYLTITEVNIDVGETSINCPIIALTPGSAGNNPPGAVNEFYRTLIDPLLTVTNEEDITGGTDRESDDSYRERLQQHQSIDGFGSKPYYIDLAESVEGVHDVIIKDYTGYTGEIWVNGDLKPCPDSVYAEVVTLLTDEYNLVMDHKFRFGKVAFTLVDLKIELLVDTVLDDTSIYTDILNGLINGGLVDGVRYNGLNIGQSLTRYSIVSALGNAGNVLDVLSIKDSDDNEITSDIQPDYDYRCLLLGDLTVTQTLYE